MGERQLTLLGDHGSTTAVRSARDLGEVFTRRWVVEFILDLSGYTPERDLSACVAVEPACGGGAFLGPMVERLIESTRLHGRRMTDARTAIRAFDLLASNVQYSRKAIATELVNAGVSLEDAAMLTQRWIERDDFLLLDQEGDAADFVLGNPPYIRLESVPKSRSEAYRRACPTMRGRSDVYVGFIEKGLRLLKADGALGFIAADRWMHNQYGAALRKLVANEFCVEAVVEMHDVDAFEDEVSAYPAVTVIRRRPQNSAVLATTTRRFTSPAALQLKNWIQRPSGDATKRTSFAAARLPGWFPGDELWPSGDPACLAFVADIEKRCPPLEDPRTQTKVGIGVATGADTVYLTRAQDLVEEDRLLPLATAADTVSGRLSWSGTHMVNPWHDGALVDLGEYPRLAAHLQENAGTLRARHVARKQPHAWYRTIDRVHPNLLSQPKLLLPELKALIHPVLDGGRFYPHHNLYFVVSGRWDIEALGGLLLSDVANLFVGTYCVKMRGGCYRFQAQYLRRIRVPDQSAVSTSEKRSLVRAFQELDREAATAVALKIYGIDALPAAARTTPY